MKLTRTTWLTWILLLPGMLFRLPCAGSTWEPTPALPTEYEAFYADVAALAAQVSTPVIVEEGFTAPPPRRPLAHDPYADNSLLPLEQAEQTVA